MIKALPKHCSNLASWASLILNELTRFVEKTVKIIRGSSILIRQNYALIYNFDVRFVEICLVFLNFLKTGWENLK